MYITKYSCVFLKLGESIYVAMDLIPILLGSFPLAHNAQHSLVIIHCVVVPVGNGEESAKMGFRVLVATFLVLIWMILHPASSQTG